MRVIAFGLVLAACSGGAPGEPPHAGTSAKPAPTGIAGVVLYDGPRQSSWTRNSIDSHACGQRVHGAAPRGDVGRLADAVVVVQPRVAQRPTDPHGRTPADCTGKLSRFLPRCRRARPHPSRTLEIAIEHCQDAPRVLVAYSGDAVAVRNRDDIAHYPIARYQQPSDRSGYATGDQVVSLRVGPRRRYAGFLLKDGGLVALRCRRHHYELGFVYVVERGDATTTDKRGRFRFTPLSPGTYDVSVWHEVLGREQLVVVVRAGHISRVKLELTMR